MWTPKRLVMLASVFSLLFGGYLGYAHSYLGGIDGLPALPDRFRMGDSPQALPEAPPRPNTVEEKIKQAFGAECDELKRPIRLDLRTQNMLLAAGQISFEKDGRVCLAPISVAMFGKNQGDGKGVEINTVKGDVAYFTFDRPVFSLPEINGRKIVGAELTSHIEVVNNRRTPQRTDDLTLYIANGPLYYSEKDHRLWTHDVVHVTDLLSQPNPTEVWGKGMEVDLIAAAPAGKPGAPAPKRKADSITGVKRVVLNSNVEMYLYVDNQGAGLPGGKEPAGPKAGEAAKAQVIIKTPGRFRYELGTDHDEAFFDAPEAPEGELPRLPPQVSVERRQTLPPAPGQPPAPPGKQPQLFDQLVCDHLQLRLRRKEAGGPGKPVDPGKGDGLDRGLEIEWSRATGKEVILTSDAEKLKADCNEFIYDTTTQTTTLRGAEGRRWYQPPLLMEANKEGTIIRARELVLRQVPVAEVRPAKAPGAPREPREAVKPKTYQQTTALGPGRIDMLDKKTDQYTVHAFWGDLLVSSKDGPYDLLVLTGDARFVDDEHQQTLEGDTLKVWLGDEAPKAAAAATPAPQASPASQARKPHHVEATGNVTAHSAEMHVHDTSKLVIRFKDEPVAALPPAAAVTTPKPAAPAAGAAGPADKPQSTPPQPGTGSVPPPGEKPPPAAPPGAAMPAAGPKPPEAPPAEPARPVVLSARSVEADVLRSDTRNTLDKVHCEGAVSVQQEPAKPGEKGVQIEGDVLTMTYHPDGNELEVTGDLAKLRMNTIYILGPDINIDQRENKAWVTGDGAMQMDSTTSFNGDPLQQPIPLIVHWHESMLFNGKFTEFVGDIQAEQGDSRLACQSMQVFFDQPVSLKQGQRGDRPPPRVQHLVCDRSVQLEETVSDKGQLVRFQRLTGTTFVMNVLEPEGDERPQPPAVPGQPGAAAKQPQPGNEATTSGPGTLRLFRKGGDDDFLPPGQPGPAPAKPKDPDATKLTLIAFQARMYANSKSNTAMFWGNVRVLEFPCKDPLQQVDLSSMPDPLPEGAMYIACTQLTVVDRAPKTQKPQREMKATGRVLVQAQDYWGRADTLTFNEVKDQIILDGGEGGMAALYLIDLKGGKPQELRGKKITYIRHSGEFKIDGGAWIQGRQAR